MTDHSVSCPQARRVYSQRKELSQWRRDPRWKALVEEHAHIPEAVCAHCGMKHGQQRYDHKGNPSINKKGEPVMVYLTINHKTRDLYLNKEAHLTWNPDKMEICCTLCNRVYEKGMKPCPKCLGDGVVTYIKWYDSECTACYFREHPDELKKAVEGRQAFKESVRQYNADQAAKRKKIARKHPCKFHRIRGICGKSMIGSQCTSSPRKVSGCGEAVMRVRT
jgi:hypothetical protein